MTKVKPIRLNIDGPLVPGKVLAIKNDDELEQVDVGGEGHGQIGTIDQTYMLGEQCGKGDIFFVEKYPTFDDVDQELLVGNVIGNTRISFPAIGTGIEGNTTNRALARESSLGEDFLYRIETDEGGRASGMLIDPNAYSIIPRSSLTDSLQDITISLAGNITIPEGQRVHEVLSQVGDAVDPTSYFKVGYQQKSTTTRDMYLFDGIDWKKENEGTVLVTDILTLGNIAPGSFYLYNYSFTIIPTTTISVKRFSFRGISATLLGQTFAPNEAIDIKLYAGVPYILSVNNTLETRGGTNVDGWSFSNIRATITINNTPNNLISFEMDSYEYQETNLGFSYVNSDLFQNELLSLADAKYTYKLPIYDNEIVKRIAITDGNIGEKVRCLCLGVGELYSNLSKDSDYYLSDIPGKISETPGTNLFPIGYSISEKSLYTEKNFYIPGTTYTLFSAPTSRSGNSVPSKVKEVEILYSGYITISFTLVSHNGYTTTGSLYKNGNLIKTGTTDSTGTITHNEIVKKGDILTLFISITTGFYNCSVNTFVGKYNYFDIETLINKSNIIQD